MIKLMHVQCPAVYNSCFWNFPETAWRKMNCRQATHPIFTCFLGSREEPPGGERCAARRRVTTNPDSGFLLELPGSDEHSPGDADQFWFGFGVLSVLIGF